MIDAKIVTPILEYLKNSGEEYNMLVMPDHPTPLALKTHTSDPVPYILYKSKDELCGIKRSYTEKEAKNTGIYRPLGHTLINDLLQIK